ncbi:hypothetical protein ACFOEQ_25630 [Chryseobacterium arachidis]|uniref:hypothetical protein n=1 Tax=Chryseobacterium arachidis TaxID=1416778 RepID=UPI0036209873
MKKLMVNFRRYISSVAVLASGFFLAQTTVSTVLYTPAYDNQKKQFKLTFSHHFDGRKNYFVAQRACRH